MDGARGIYGASGAFIPEVTRRVRQAAQDDRFIYDMDFRDLTL
jgi:hypothetical protein